MTNTHLKQFDLNLLVSLDTLLQLRHVSQAADALSLTQSGMSRNLARLREHFGDELLVRTGNQMGLTPKAEQLAAEVRLLLNSLDKMLSVSEFNPKTASLQFTIAAADFLMQLFIPDLLPAFLEQAPHAKLKLVPWSEHTFSQLQSGKMDFMFGGLSDAPTGVYRKTFGDVQHGCITRKNHPLLNNKLTLDNYIQAGHIALDLTGKGTNPVDEWLKSKGLTRNIVVRTPYCMSAIAMASVTDLVMMGHYDLYDRAKKYYDIDFLPLPFQIPMPSFGLYWHERTKNSLAHRWFREFIESMSQPPDSR